MLPAGECRNLEGCIECAAADPTAIGAELLLWRSIISRLEDADR
jgi:hypothetical protein